MRTARSVLIWIIVAALSVALGVALVQYLVAAPLVMGAVMVLAVFLRDEPGSSRRGGVQMGRTHCAAPAYAAPCCHRVGLLE